MVWSLNVYRFEKKRLTYKDSNEEDLNKEKINYVDADYTYKYQDSEDLNPTIKKR